MANNCYKYILYLSQHFARGCMWIYKNRNLEGNIADAVEVLPLSNPKATFPAITICPTYGAAYNSSQLKVKYCKTIV